MNNLATIDDKFVDDYIFNHRNNLSKPTVGGTDWRFADIVAPAFKEILEIANPEKVLEIGFNIGGSALMFLSINQKLQYHSLDIRENIKSVNYLESKFIGFRFIKIDSRLIKPDFFCLFSEYDLGFIDGDHTREVVISDIETALQFKPKYLLFDDVLHPSHLYIHDLIISNNKLEIVKLWSFDHCWKGYSMALCKVIE